MDWSFLAMARLMCYGVGIVMSAVVAVDLLRMNHRLAKALGVIMIMWGINVFIHLFNRLSGLMFDSHMWTGRNVVMTFNAFLMAAGPVVLWVILKNGGRE